MKTSTYFVYLLRCADNSIYTGITTNIERRFQEHFSQGEKSAKYTRTRKAIRIEHFFEVPNR